MNRENQPPVTYELGWVWEMSCSNSQLPENCRSIPRNLQNILWLNEGKPGDVNMSPVGLGKIGISTDYTQKSLWTLALWRFCDLGFFNKVNIPKLIFLLAHVTLSPTHNENVFLHKCFEGVNMQKDCKFVEIFFIFFESGEHFSSSSVLKSASFQHTEPRIVSRDSSTGRRKRCHVRTLH